MAMIVSFSELTKEKTLLNKTGLNCCYLGMTNPNQISVCAVCLRLQN